MPPKGGALTTAQVVLLTRWIAEGAGGGGVGDKTAATGEQGKPASLPTAMQEGAPVFAIEPGNEIEADFFGADRLAGTGH